MAHDNCQAKGEWERIMEDYLSERVKREAVARKKLAEVLDWPASGPRRWVEMSNLLYDAGSDGNEYADGEGGYFIEDNGFDCDDLATALLEVIDGIHRD